MSRCTSLANTILGTVARDLHVISAPHGEKSRLKDLMVQVPLLLTIDNSFLTVLSRQKSSFDIRCRDSLAEYGFAKVNRVEDRFRIAFPDGYERLPIVLHDMLPCQDKIFVSRNPLEDCGRRHSSEHGSTFRSSGIRLRVRRPTCRVVDLAL
jgi:hypothetical protein